MNYQNRVEKLKQKVDWQKYDAILVSSNPTVIYLTGYSNFASDERDAYLLITKTNEYLITDGRFTEAVHRDVKHFTVLERSKNNPLSDILKKIKEENNLNVVGIEESHLTVSEYKFFKKNLGKLINYDISDIRIEKDVEEIANIKSAGDLADRAVEHIKSLITEKITEKELALAFELFLKKEGSDISFPTIVAFSKNSSVAHHQTGDDVLNKKSGQFVLIDCGAKYKNYCSDMTRTFFFGQPNEQQIKIYNTVLNAQQKAVDLLTKNIKAGKKVTGKMLDKASSEYIISQGYEPYNHSLGHGTGLEVHEGPTISTRGKIALTEGMVFSIEPGIYIKGLGGVRIEDLYVIKKDRVEQLTNYSKELIIL